LTIGYDKKSNQYYIDRTLSGNVDFKKGFSAIHYAPRIDNKQKMNMSIIIDVSSMELFADNGLTVMTEIFFPDKPYDKISIETNDRLLLKRIEFMELKSIWH
jgi:fructan beta-fructosidase